MRAILQLQFLNNFRETLSNFRNVFNVDVNLKKCQKPRPFIFCKWYTLPQSSRTSKQLHWPLGKECRPRGGPLKQARRNTCGSIFFFGESEKGFSAPFGAVEDFARKCTSGCTIKNDDTKFNSKRSPGSGQKRKSLPSEQSRQINNQRYVRAPPMQPAVQAASEESLFAIANEQLNTIYEFWCTGKDSSGIASTDHTIAWKT